MDPVIQLDTCYCSKEPSGDFSITAQYREDNGNGKTPNEDRWKIKLSRKDAEKLRVFLIHQLAR